MTTAAAIEAATIASGWAASVDQTGPRLGIVANVSTADSPTIVQPAAAGEISPTDRWSRPQAPAGRQREQRQRRGQVPAVEHRARAGRAPAAPARAGRGVGGSHGRRSVRALAEAAGEQQEQRQTSPAASGDRQRAAESSAGVAGMQPDQPGRARGPGSSTMSAGAMPGAQPTRSAEVVQPAEPAAAQQPSTGRRRTPPR